MSLWFSRKGRLPKCLGNVLPQLVNSGTLREKDDYVFFIKDQITKQKASWTTWGYQVLVSSPVKQLTKALISKVQGHSDQGHKVYIIPNNVKKLANSVLRNLQTEATVPGADNSQLVFSYDELKERLKHMRLLDLDILLLYMEYDKLLCQAEHRGKVLFKFKDSKSSKLEPINDVEKGVWDLRQSKEHLESLLSSLHTQMLSCTDSVKEQLKLKNRPQAKRLLRKRKLLEKKVTTTELHLSRVESILDEIHNAQTNQMVLEAYSHGTTALKQMNTVTPINLVDKTMDELTSEIETSMEISGSLTSDSLSDNSDDPELESELEQLLNDEGNVDELLSHLDKLAVVNDSIDSMSGSSDPVLPTHQTAVTE